MQDVESVVLIGKGDSDLGWGHVSRLVAIGNALIARNPEIKIFLVVETADKSSCPLIENTNFFAIYNCELAFSAIGILASKLVGCGSIRAVIDHPTLSYADMSKVFDISGSFALFYTPLRSCNPAEFVRVLICPRPELPKDILAFSGKVLSGLEYTPLDSAFYLRTERDVSKETTVFICLGGSDQSNNILAIIDCLDSVGFRGHACVAMARHCERIQNKLSTATFGSHLSCGKTSRQLIAEIDKADFGIVSAGTIFRECLARNLVCGVVEVTEDQRGLSSVFEKQGLSVSIRIDDKDSFEKFNDRIVIEAPRIKKIINALDFKAGLNVLLDSIMSQ